jgi:hypothetical protein
VRGLAEPEFSCEIDGVDYSIAETIDDREAVYRFRHFILVETDQYFPNEGSDRILDVFDHLHETRLIQARIAGALVGSLRLVIDGTEGVPSDDFFDVRGTIKNLNGIRTDTIKIGDLNRIVVDRSRRNREIGFHLMTIGHFLGIRLGVTHFAGVSNPKTITLFVNRLGWEIVGERMFDASHNVDYIPIIGTATKVKVFSGRAETG